MAETCSREVVIKEHLVLGCCVCVHWVVFVWIGLCLCGLGCVCVNRAVFVWIGLCLCG